MIQFSFFNISLRTIFFLTFQEQFGNFFFILHCDVSLLSKMKLFILLNHCFMQLCGLILFIVATHSLPFNDISHFACILTVLMFNRLNLISCSKQTTNTKCVYLCAYVIKKRKNINDERRTKMT